MTDNKKLDYTDLAKRMLGWFETSAFAVGMRDPGEAPTRFDNLSEKHRAIYLLVASSILDYLFDGER